MYKKVKDLADGLMQRISQALPEWQHYTVERTFPARPPYQPTMPANIALLAANVTQQFALPIAFAVHRIFQLRKVSVTWDGAVFHNLRLFVPSIVHPRFTSRFQDTLLLRQWIGEQVVLPAPCVAVCHDQWSAENYYHWLVDTLPRLLVLRQSHPNMLLLLPQPEPPKQRRDYIDSTAAALGFKDYIPLNTRQILRADCVVLPELTAASLTQNPELMQQVRAELVAAFWPVPATSATRKVYVARASHGVRSIINEPELDELMERYGFEKVYFESLSFLEQVHLMSETAVLLGVHGAGMTNMMFLPEGAKVIELLNADYGDPCYFRLASCLGLPYYCAPCQGTDEGLANQSDMLVDIAMLQRIIALVMA